MPYTKGIGNAGQVLEKVQKELLDYKGTGISVLCTSHRSKEFTQINDHAEATLRKLLDVPPNYSILFLQGGGVGQFAGIPLNLLNGSSEMDYAVTGYWSNNSAKEAGKYGQVNSVLPKLDSYTGIPDRGTWKLSPQAAYLYYCGNETICGVEFQDVPAGLPGVPLVCDMSSHFLTRPVDVSKYGLIMAAAQKNVGPAGVTVVIVRDDLLGRANPLCPSILDYTQQKKNKSILNTPCCFSLYVTDLVLEWILENGGVEEMERRCIEKSESLYGAIDGSRGFYSNPVDPGCRSRTNVPFRVGGAGGDEALEKAFLEGAAQKHMIQLKGHRSVGGVRASLYNAVTKEEVECLRSYMIEFQEAHQN
ncbi:unnamed protein product [Darwinula stevensoni]|uniref:Phosphoserine aminotransferase n=1 Tax=Darwinula stevensoni TaxID=69355 RepID=A0A7R8X137_9CRUS|nr:unnamed protein product [Darwinula stevensoni]CAG0881843.1 unnamed protein product [Darwinula stevensoni]